ncbi:MAG: polysaccharide biosynthesis/export family protein [Promethearchaeota archaeon]
MNLENKVQYPKKNCWLLAIITLLLFSRIAVSQEIYPKLENRTEDQKRASQLLFQQRDSYWKKEPTLPDEKKKFELSIEQQALEKTIDPDSYIVGPGDLFYINISGEADFMFPTQVTPEGKLVVETMGIYYVAGKTLSEVQNLILNEGTKKYKIKKIFANLVQMRTIRVHVVGEVKYPGIYFALPVDRVSVIIEQAGPLTDWADEQHIEIRHSEGTVDTFNYFKYQKFGELEQNIYVQSGDVIYVPAIRLDRSTVILEGFVEQRGAHQIQPGEKLSTFLRRIKGFDRSLDPAHIYVIRNDDHGNLDTIHVNLTDNEKRDENYVKDLKLRDDDKIYIPSLLNRVYVQGAVNVPGGYFYMAGFRAIDYVGLAGGNRETGNLNGIKVIHCRNNSIEKGANIEIEPGDTIIVPQNFRRKFSEYLSIVTSIVTLTLAYMAFQK